jgi:protein-tyrosine-phosphatase
MIEPAARPWETAAGFLEVAVTGDGGPAIMSKTAMGSRAAPGVVGVVGVALARMAPHAAPILARERARVDRIACPWLISRFIDPTPEFLFVPANEVLDVAKRENAIPYDIPKVELGHHGPQCSFDAFVERYELADPALAGLARIVRGADTDDRGLTPESAGLYAAATGFQASSRDDFDNMARQFPMYDAFYAYCRALVSAAARPRVLFVCLHGAAKSVIGAAHFRRLAAARGLAMDAVAAGTEPDPELAPAAVAGLAGDGLRAAPNRPRPVTLYDLDSVTRVVSFGCEIAPAKGERVDQWNVPAVSEGYAAARDRIVARVERLVSELAAER